MKIQVNGKSFFCSHTKLKGLAIIAKKAMNENEKIDPFVLYNILSICDHIDKRHIVNNIHECEDCGTQFRKFSRRTTDAGGSHEDEDYYTII